MTATTAFADTLEQFRAAVAGPAAGVPLLRAALLIARAEYPALDLDAYEARVATLARRLEARIHPADELTSQLAAVRQLLFVECGLHGNRDAYGDPRNLYLNDVLDAGAGIPVSLAIVYVAVAQGAGLAAEIVGLPGHVVVRAGGPGGVFVDPFDGGRELDAADCARLVRNVYGRRSPFRDHHLEPITPRQALARVLQNLKAGYLQRGDEERAGRVIELLLALWPWDLDERRDRGMLRERLGEYAGALDDLEAYVRYRSSARDVRTIGETVRSLRRQVGSG
jgi:regulator of sirC expression with transglutaminase-like and TPR domain